VGARLVAYVSAMEVSRRFAVASTAPAGGPVMTGPEPGIAAGRAQVGPSADPRAGDPLDVTARRLVNRFVSWLDAFGDRSHDPYDLWAWRPGMRAKRRYYGGGVSGVLAASPVVALDTLLPAARKLISSPHRYPIADAHFAIGFLRLAEAGDARAPARAQRFLTVLQRTRCPGFDDYCWGYPFHWETRGGPIPAGIPLMTTVPYAYEAYERGYEQTGEPAYLRVMESVATFAAERIAVSPVAGGTAAAYTPFDHSTVVNASAYRGFLLASAGRRFGRPGWTGAADRNIAFVLGVQRADGSWPYAAPPADEPFVDNIHTCMVLKNLVKYWHITDRDEVLAGIRRGYEFYRRRLLDEQGQPVPFAVKPRLTLVRRDLYDHAEGINLAHLLEPVVPQAGEILRTLVAGLARDWALPDGHFITRQTIAGRNVIPYHRWAQAATFSALAALCRAPGLERREEWPTRA
jgi:hypothetical protein